uniref:tRNA-5-taurinomethyluridine 2-sulfurtransferase n=1 Tax=Acartia pacifica TaxID=335913 RepID=A0A0U2V5K3_ACAPC|nr:mitochondrial tRNA-specific 2-thiouridylase 1 [Acartia pacifica]
MLRRGVRRVVLGMSGGVDSTVSAILLRQRGLEVIGVFMRNWDGVDETGVCSADKDCEEAERIANQIGVKFHVVNFVKEYWNEVFTDLIEDYSAGLTPNPDVLCNSRLKFTHFHDYALNTIGCDAVATGHYARNSLGDNLESTSNSPAFLLQAIDRTKDQTFFLSQIPQSALKKTIFPVGELTKKVVKEIARQSGFPEIADKKESMGICFVGKKKSPGRRGFQEFIAEYIDPKLGNFIDIDTGAVVGTHNGVHQWTIGQRTKLKLKDQAYFVVSKDATRNVIQVASDPNHPALYSDSFFTLSPHWISGAPDELLSFSSQKTLACEFRCQNMAPLTSCHVSYNMSSTSNWEYMDRDRLIVSVAEPLRSITPGQFSVFYKGDVCLGSARIDRPGPSLYTLNIGNCRTKIRNKLKQE